MRYYLKIIRPLNLALLILCLYLIKYGFLEKFPISFALQHAGNFILVSAVVFIAAGGYVINDIQDVAIDSINKPKKVIVGRHISEKNAFTYYTVLTTLGVLCGFIVSNLVDKPSLAAIFIIVSAALYWYATTAKNSIFFGNLLVSLLVGFSLILPILFDIFPVLTGSIDPYYTTVSKSILIIAVIAWYLNLMREIVKDVEDINGDKNGGRTTLPMVLGISRTKNIIFGMGVFALFMLLFFCYYQLYNQQLLLAYFIFAMGGSLLFFCIKAWNASKKIAFTQLSNLLKIIMLVGTVSIALLFKLYH